MTVTERHLEIQDAPYFFHATQASVTGSELSVLLPHGATILIPLKALGEPWASATRAKVRNVRLRMGGTWLWWDDLGEGLVLDDLMQSALNVNAGAILARKARGKVASPAKAAAARANGARGGRPRKKGTS